MKASGGHAVYGYQVTYVCEHVYSVDLLVDSMVLLCDAYKRSRGTALGHGGMQCSGGPRFMVIGGWENPQGSWLLLLWSAVLAVALGHWQGCPATSRQQAGPGTTLH